MLGFSVIDYIKTGAGIIVGAFLAWLVFYVFVVPYKVTAARHEGRAEIVQQVTKQNEQAGVIARRAKDNVDACYDINGDWDQERGECVQHVP